MPPTYTQPGPVALTKVGYRQGDLPVNPPAHDSSSRRRRVMVACERSGIVRDAFAQLGWDAWSCDIVPSDRPGQHIVEDVRLIRLDEFDLLIAHPPCTYLTNANPRRGSIDSPNVVEAMELFVWLMTAPVNRICVENPVGLPNRLIGKPDQIIHPWMFGHAQAKRTCIWLKNLPPLMATCVMSERDQRWCDNLSAKRRSVVRSETFPGVAAAMAAQWGGYG